MKHKKQKEIIVRKPYVGVKFEESYDYITKYGVESGNKDNSGFKRSFTISVHSDLEVISLVHINLNISGKTYHDTVRIHDLLHSCSVLVSNLDDVIFFKDCKGKMIYAGPEYDQCDSEVTKYTAYAVHNINNDLYKITFGPTKTTEDTESSMEIYLTRDEITRLYYDIFSFLPSLAFANTRMQTNFGTSMGLCRDRLTSRNMGVSSLIAGLSVGSIIYAISIGAQSVIPSMVTIIILTIFGIQKRI